MSAEPIGYSLPSAPGRQPVPGTPPPPAAWVSSHLVTVSIGDERTRIVLDTGDATCACELRLGTQRLLQTWQQSSEVTQEDVEAMTAWARTLIQPLVEPLRRSKPLELTFAGEHTLMVALLLGQPLHPRVGRHRIAEQALSDWQNRFAAEASHTDATLVVLATVLLMRVVLEAAQLESALVLGNTPS
jgi:exopolyphosphatase/pppGpp-phosphohydrolase